MSCYDAAVIDWVFGKEKEKRKLVGIFPNNGLDLCGFLWKLSGSWIFLEWVLEGWDEVRF